MILKVEGSTPSIHPSNSYIDAQLLLQPRIFWLRLILNAKNSQFNCDDGINVELIYDVCCYGRIYDAPIKQYAIGIRLQFLRYASLINNFLLTSNFGNFIPTQLVSCFKLLTTHPGHFDELELG